MLGFHVDRSVKRSIGSSSQEIRYPVATTGAENINAINRVLADLCSRSNPKVSRAVFCTGCLILILINEVSQNMGALRAINELIDVTINENTSKVAKFSNYMRAAYETKRDPEILVLASKVLGHLVRYGGAMTVDEVEHQEMVENASTGFNVHVPEFVDAIWVALRDPTLAVREKAVEALRACLRVIEKCETRWRVQCYYRMFEATQDRLGRNAPVHSIHGSLLAVGEPLSSGYIKEDLRVSLPQDGAALTLRRLVEEEACDLSGEAFAHFMDHLYERITTFLDSNEVSENLGALRAIDELIDVTISENASKVAKFSNYILKEMAENASTVFNVHVPKFMDAIWVALRDPTLVVRVKADEALRACLRVIEKRETRWRVLWYYRMCEATQDRLGRNTPVQSIHRSLLVVGKLLRKTGEFMMSRYREVAEIVLRYLEHRGRLVRLSITSLLPRIAHFLRDRFICMNHILHVLKIPAERASGFIALGEMAGALDGELINYLPTITSHLRDAFSLILDLGLHGHDLLEFTRESVVMYLEDEDGATRKDAALCCCKLVANSFSTISSTQFSPSRFNRASGKRRRRLVEEENESKAAKLKSLAKGSKNFMSMMISASSKITQSRKKKILEERNDPVMKPKETVPINGLPPVTKTPKRVTFFEASLNSESLSDTPSPSPLSIRSFPSHPRTSENNNSTPRRRFNGNLFLRPSVHATHRGFNPVTPANSHADSTIMVSNSGKGELGSFSLSWGFDEKENESKAAKLKSPSKGSKNFMFLTISTSSKIAQSRKKKILVERNDPVRTSITLSDGKATFFSANSDEHKQNSKKVMEPKETVSVDGLPPVTKTPKRVMFLEASLNFESLSDTVTMDSDICNDEPLVSPALASLDADPSLPPYNPKTIYLSLRKPKLDYFYLFELLSENLSDTDGSESSLTKDLLEDSNGSSSEEAFTEATVDQEEEPIIHVAKQIDEPALPVFEDISEAKMKLKSRSSTILSTGSKELDKKSEPIELEEDEESETEPDEEEFQMDADLDDSGEVEIEGVDVLEKEEDSAVQLAKVNGADRLEKDVEQGKHDLVETEKVSVVPAEGNESDSSERDLDQGLTTSNVEVYLAESQSFIVDNALESMIDNPKSIVKEISAVEEPQTLEMMESPIRHDEDIGGAYQILGKK
ncbi:Serine/threonine-protein kinase TOR [Capsicum baccatum]|uniref:Serine/threonine-protein kinase TOR n=1 Tax=Capsicum baccatum TaxID=33114 RepID=A0A2G2V7H7_CAPBA|nr:Serine/threonine-protein kinase TOR [Capsicum baccatum]